MKASSIILVVIVIALAIFAVTKFGNKGSDQNADVAPQQLEDNSIKTMDTSNDTSSGEVKKLDNGLQIEVLKEGSGDEIKNGQTASVSYTGMFTDGKKFDSNVDPSFNHVEPFEFSLGAGQVIAGWDQGVLGMKVGEKRKLTVPYSLGYGENGYGPIPAKATLVFEVELLAIK